MRRENRRVAAMSWGAGDDMPPPKPARVPHAGILLKRVKYSLNCINQPRFLDSSSLLSLGVSSQGAPQTYIVAQNPTVLAQLMRENEARTLNPSAYTTPASVFNTLAVDFDSEKVEPGCDTATVSSASISSCTASVLSNDIPLKTVIMPAADLLKLDRMAPDKTASDDTITESILSPLINPHAIVERYPPAESMVIVGDDGILCQTNVPISQSAQLPPPVFPIPCEIINALTQQTHSIDPMYKVIKKTSSIEQSQFVHLNTGGSSLQAVGYHPTNYSQQSAAMQQVNNASIYSPSSGGTVPMHFQYQYQQQQQFIQPGNLMYMPQQHSLPPDGSQQQQKSNSLERNAVGLTYANRMSSLERVQHAQKQSRSNSLTRQMSAGQEYSISSRSSSFERQQIMVASGAISSGSSCRTNSLERQPGAMAGGRGGSLERNQSIASTYDLMKMRGYRGGSLERNQQQQLQQGVAIAVTGRAGSLERNPQYHAYRSQMKQQPSADVEPFQEEIYDFGGANVKSCASIALSKSISKGMVPAGTMLPPQSPIPQQQQHYVQHPGGPPPPYSYHIPPSYPLSPQQQQLQQNQMLHLQQQQHQQIYAANATYTQMHPRIWPPTSSPSPQPQQQQQNHTQTIPTKHNSLRQVPTMLPQNMKCFGSQNLQPLLHQQQPVNYTANQTGAPVAQVCSVLLASICSFHLYTALLVRLWRVAFYFFG